MFYLFFSKKTVFLRFCKFIFQYFELWQSKVNKILTFFQKALNICFFLSIILSPNDPSAQDNNLRFEQEATNELIVAKFSVFTQPIFYIEKTGLHQFVPENFLVKNVILFS